MNTATLNRTEYSVPAYTPLGESVYSVFEKKCAALGDAPALSYFGKEYSFSKLMYNIDRAAAGLLRMGIGKGDKVIVSLPSVPEAVELFYAINKIGAVFCGMDCRSTSDEIDEIFAQIQPKACFVSDFHLKAFSHIQDVQIICISFMRTIGIVTAFASVFVGLFTGRTFLIARKKNFQSYQSFIKNIKHPKVKKAAFGGDEICAYFYTSGTTYGRKCVMLTNENMNSSVLQYAYSQPGIEDTERFCTIMPLFTCYGITLGTHLPLILGKQVRMIPLFTGKAMKKLLLVEKPGYITTVPAHWEQFIKDDFTGADLSFFKGAIIGGDKLSAVAEDKINAILKRCGSQGKVMRGYGLTEASTAVTAQPPQTPKGSVGTNMCWSTIGIFEMGTDKPVEVGCSGEICVCGPNVCQGYLDDEKTSAALLRQPSDGKIWLPSGDVGYMDENNFLYFCERMKRIFVRFDGTKISPYGIEQQLYRCPVVAHCMEYGSEDPKHAHGKCPAAWVVFKEEYDEKQAKQIYENFINTKIAYHLRPIETSFVNALPVTKNGKLDYFRTLSTKATVSK